MRKTLASTKSRRFYGDMKRKFSSKEVGKLYSVQDLILPYF